jgi:hypothetical protein
LLPTEKKLTLVSNGVKEPLGKCQEKRDSGAKKQIASSCFNREIRNPAETNRVTARNQSPLKDKRFTKYKFWDHMDRRISRK